MGFASVSESLVLTPEQEAQLRAAAVSDAPAELSKLETVETEMDLFYALPRATFAAYHLEKFALAGELARKSLDIAPLYMDNWNYGNAIHAAHTVLGLLALRNENLKVALDELKKSGDTKGSPQLGSFGPTMQLAKALLRNGESQAVLAYLEQCRVFWKMGGEWLDIWEEKIKAGTVPNFFMHGFR